ncbi:NAD-dependent epimerase/dehydratase family protein [Mycobacterium sp. ST-F2]|uniref:NAD-dependent epimerase/dehydratase family protein n=1 Tax=Mycobacterium sp. ST-F2 TaxID=1490484 RepID=UPI00093A8887|nr:NAD-dependent epimerase/dehydratase family protein [Mycobacterium sp. ST-F2]
MKVLVTGGTGFVGAHIVSALIRDGHDVRMLVRRSEQVPISLGPLEVSVDDLVVGDVLDAEVVAAALDGVEAVVHAAAVFSLDARRAAEITRTNLRATELVVGGAVERGLDPVIHISSTVALTCRDGGGPDLPLGDVDLPYAKSKRESEVQIRAFQSIGAPVVSVYPGGVLGPHDPYVGTQAELFKWIVKGRFPIWPSGGAHYVDVRDVADVVAACMAQGYGPRRYVVPGHHLDGDLMNGTLHKITGRWLPFISAPAMVAKPFTQFAELVNKVLPGNMHLPADAETVELAERDTRFDTSLTTEELGIEARPFEETVTDTLLWLIEIGALGTRYAGNLR